MWKYLLILLASCCALTGTTRNPDLSGPLLPATETGAMTDADIDSIAATIEYSMSMLVMGGHSNSKSYNLPEQKNLSGIPYDELYLQLDINISSPSDIAAQAIRSQYGWIALSGSSDLSSGMLKFPLLAVDIKPGRHTYTIPFSIAEKSGDPDMGAICRFSAGIDKTYSRFDYFYLAVSNIKIIHRRKAVYLPEIFSHGMIVQRDKPFNVFGYAPSGQEISVNLLSQNTMIQSLTVQTDSCGRWFASLSPLQGGYTTYQLEIAANGSVTHHVDDILAGELWVTAGQSNMELPVGGTVQRFEMMDEADDPWLRFLYMPPYPSSGSRTGTMPLEPRKTIPGAHWGHGDCGAQTGAVSAAGYIAASELRRHLDMPVGFIHMATGGSTIESWMDRDAVRQDSIMSRILSEAGLYMPDTIPSDASAGALFNQKTAPLRGMNIAGVMWYQGEANVDRPEYYAMELKNLYRSWSSLFGFDRHDMPMIVCQTGRWGIELAQPQYIAMLDEAMADAMRDIENEGGRMALLPIYDTDMSYLWNVMIHPTNKFPVGRRLAASAINMIYQGMDPHTAPMPVDIRYDGKYAYVRFEHCGNGLQTIDGSNDVRGFTICDIRGIHTGARAEIEGINEVRVWNESVARPSGVSYAFSSCNFNSNLANSALIPAAPFRSDRSPDHLLFNPQDWTYADTDSIWSIISPSEAGMVPTWTACNASLSFGNHDENPDSFSARRFMKVSYANNHFSSPEFSPETTPAGVVPQIASFQMLGMEIANPDARFKTIYLLILDSYGHEISRIGQPVDANQNWIDTQFIFPETVGLSDATNLAFEIEDNSGAASGTLLIDNIYFGLKPLFVGENTFPDTQSSLSCHYIDMLGRRYASPPSPGIYIHKGQRIIIR